MQISVNIEDEKLNEILKAGVENVDKKVVDKLVADALEKAFSDEDMVKRMIFKVSGVFEHATYFGDAQDWVAEAVKRVITEGDCDKFRKRIFEVFEKDGKEIIISAMAEVLVSQLFSPENQREFSVMLARTVLNQ